MGANDIRALPPAARAAKRDGRNTEPGAVQPAQLTTTPAPIRCTAFAALEEIDTLTLTGTRSIAALARAVARCIHDGGRHALTDAHALLDQLAADAEILGNDVNCIAERACRADAPIAEEPGEGAPMMGILTADGSQLGALGEFAESHLEILSGSLKRIAILSEAADAHLEVYDGVVIDRDNMRQMFGSISDTVDEAMRDLNCARADFAARLAMAIGHQANEKAH